MQFKQTTSLKKISALRARLRICQGGARAGKTIAILMCLIDLATNPAMEKLVISVVSETMPHLSRGAMRDFENIMKARLYWEQERYNKQTHTYTFPNGNQTPAETWASGVRTPYGLAFSPTGELWEVEQGPQGGDHFRR